MADATGTVKHRFTSPVADAGSATEVGPVEWNDTLVMGGGSEGMVPVRRTGATDGWLWSYIGAAPANVQNGSVQNSGAGETDLMSHSIAANSLNVNNRSIKFEFWGTTAANATAKTLKFKLGTKVITLNPTTGSPNALNWKGTAWVIRTGSNAQMILVKFEFTGLPAELLLIDTATETDSATIIAKLTGQGGANGDITQRFMAADYKG